MAILFTIGRITFSYCQNTTNISYFWNTTNILSDASIVYIVLFCTHGGFQELTIILSTLLPVVCINNDNKEHSDFSVGLKVKMCSLFFVQITQVPAFYFMDFVHRDSVVVCRC